MNSIERGQHRYRLTDIRTYREPVRPVRRVIKSGFLDIIDCLIILDLFILVIGIFLFVGME